MRVATWHVRALMGMVVALVLWAGPSACGPRCGPGTRESGELCMAVLGTAQPTVPTEAHDVVDGELPELPDPGTPTGLTCTTAFDCPPRLACRGGACIVPPAVCARDRDCPYGLVCDAGACVTDCAESNAACPSDRVCVDGRCVAPPATCRDVKDCPFVGNEMACEGGHCVAHCDAPCSCVDGFVCRAGVCEREAATCQFADDCGCVRGGARACDGGGCGQVCLVAVDCPAGDACLDGRCARPPAICGGDGDCPDHDGPMTCVYGACKRACKDACDCRPPALGDNGETCVAGFCALVGFTCDAASECGCKDGRKQSCGEDHTCTFGSCQTSCDCPDGLFCADGRCVANAPSSCDGTHDCACGEPCTSRHGFPMCGCELQEDCTGDTVCDLATRRCIPAPAHCDGKADCPSEVGTRTNAPSAFCQNGSCASCEVPFGPCEGNDLACPSCNGEPMLCHAITSYGICRPPCSSGLDCYFTFGTGACHDGRCVETVPRAACDAPEDCPGAELEASQRFAFQACENHRCVPASCEDSGDCAPYAPSTPVDPFVCRAGHCVPAPAICIHNSDCAWPYGTPMTCVAPGTCQ